MGVNDTNSDTDELAHDQTTAWCFVEASVDGHEFGSQRHVRERVHILVLVLLDFFELGHGVEGERCEGNASAKQHSNVGNLHGARIRGNKCPPSQSQK